MITSLSILVLFAIVAAVGAASRVQRQLTEPSTQVSGGVDRQVHSLQEQEVTIAHQNRVEPDHDAERDLSSSSPTELSADSESLPELSLAASLTVTELLHPPETDLSISLDPTSGDIEITPSSETLKQVHDRPNLLAELAQLEHSGHHEQIAHLSRYTQHSDSVMRATAAFALGELADKTQGQETAEIAALLQQFTQDANPQVRSQAIAAMGKLQLS